MAHGALQLFPPPERPQQRNIPPRWPTRTSSRRDQFKVEDAEHGTERMAGATSQVDFHELVIRVNSNNNSPVEVQQIHSIETPKQAYLPNNAKSPEQSNNPYYQRARTDSAMSTTTREQKPRGGSPLRIETNMSAIPVATSVEQQTTRQFPPPPPLNKGKRVASPVPASVMSSRNIQTPPPMSHESSRPKGASPAPEDHNGVIGLAISADHLYSPERQRVASPALSEAASARSGSPTLVRANSAATADTKRKQLRVDTEQPVMRSIFPRYNPEVSLAQQSYLPMITNPPSRIPREKINRPINSPKYTPHANIESLEDDGPAPRCSAAIPYYTPPTALDSLWHAANGQGNPMIQMYTLQIHCVNSGVAGGESKLILGPSESQPFYTLSHSELPPADLLDNGSPEDNADHELLITRHNPTRPGAFPVSHFTLAPTPTSAMTSPDLSNPAALIENSVVLISTIYPKMAAVAALETAAQSPAASHIAMFDPNATSPAAERLAQDVLLGTAQRECCALIWTRSPYPQNGQFAAATPGTYALHHPTLGVFPITHEGEASPGLSPMLGSSSFQSPRQRPRANSKPTRITILNPFATPPEQRSPDSPNDDSVLARLDFGADSLVLNVAAILRLNNPYLIDVIVSTLLSVALAEEKRTRREIRFEAPPLQATAPSRSNTEPSLKKKKSFWQRVGKKAENKVRQKVKYDSAIDLEAWGAPPKEEFKDKNGGQGEKEELPFLTHAILGVLTFTFRTAIWVLSISIKIIGGVVVKVSHWVVTKA